MGVRREQGRRTFKQRIGLDGSDDFFDVTYVISNANDVVDLDNLGTRDTVKYLVERIDGLEFEKPDGTVLGGDDQDALIEYVAGDPEYRQGILSCWLEGIKKKDRFKIL